MSSDPGAVARAVARRHTELAQLLQGLSVTDLTASSRLPGWDRLTIVNHLRYGAEANLAMTDDAIVGRPASFYPAGRATQRPATLLLRSGEQANDAVSGLVEASERLDERWASLELESWSVVAHEPDDNPDLGPTPLAVLALLRLTEVEVHGTDLDLDAREWSRTFVEAGFPRRVRSLLTRRSNHAPVDEDIAGTWLLDATDGPAFAISCEADGVSVTEGRDIEVDARLAGSGRDLLAFLLGRTPLEQLTVSGDRALAASFHAAFPPP